MEIRTRGAISKNKVLTAATQKGAVNGGRRKYKKKGKEGVASSCSTAPPSRPFSILPPPQHPSAVPTSGARLLRPSFRRSPPPLKTLVSSAPVSMAEPPSAAATPRRRLVPVGRLLLVFPASVGPRRRPHHRRAVSVGSPPPAASRSSSVSGRHHRPPTTPPSVGRRTQRSLLSLLLSTRRRRSPAVKPLVLLRQAPPASSSRHDLLRHGRISLRQPPPVPKSSQPRASSRLRSDQLRSLQVAASGPSSSSRATAKALPPPSLRRSRCRRLSPTRRRPRIALPPTSSRRCCPLQRPMKREVLDLLPVRQEVHRLRFPHAVCGARAHGQPVAEAAVLSAARRSSWRVDRDACQWELEAH